MVAATLLKAVAFMSLLERLGMREPAPRLARVKREPQGEIPLPILNERQLLYLTGPGRSLPCSRLGRLSFPFNLCYWWGEVYSPVSLHEIIVSKIQSDRSSKVFKLLAESFG